MPETIQHQKSDEFSSNTSGNRSRLPPREEDHRTPSQKGQTGASGPRTQLGKRTSSQNAVKFGIFSRATLLKGESRGDYESLLKGLWKKLQPEGKLEELLVERLTVISWRYQRFLLAESAEIQKASDFLESDWYQNEQVEAEEELGRFNQIEGNYDGPPGLIWRIENTCICKLCLEILDQLRQRIKAKGLEEKHDDWLLKKIYGNPDKPRLQRTLHYHYLCNLSTAALTEEERARGGYATPDRCKLNVLRDIDAEFDRLKQYKTKRESIESERRTVEMLRQSVPESPAMDRLVRYEASLDRSFDRTLIQLERLQRTRKGQPLPTQVNVNIS